VREVFAVLVSHELILIQVPLVIELCLSGRALALSLLDIIRPRPVVMLVDIRLVEHSVHAASSGSHAGVVAYIALLLRCVTGHAWIIGGGGVGDVRGGDGGVVQARCRGKECSQSLTTRTVD
jgi:hypothetical protein